MSLEIVKTVSVHIEPAYVVVRNIAVTFLEGAFVAWGLTGFAPNRLAVGGAIGGGCSAVWNIIIRPWAIHKGFIKA